MDRIDMNSTIQYKDYIGSVELAQEDKLFYGKDLRIRALIVYEGINEKELVVNFEEAVDEYLALCEVEKESLKNYHYRLLNVLALLRE